MIKHLAEPKTKTLWKLVHLQQLVQSTELGVASRREWSTPSNTRGDSAVSQREEEEEWGSGWDLGLIIEQLHVNPSPVAASSSPRAVFHFPPPPSRPPHRKHPTSLFIQCHRLQDGRGGAARDEGAVSAGLSVIPGGRSQWAEPSLFPSSAPPSWWPQTPCTPRRWESPGTAGLGGVRGKKEKRTRGRVWRKEGGRKRSWQMNKGHLFHSTTKGNDSSRAKGTTTHKKSDLS